MELQEELRKIKQQLRLSMNGVASAFMRDNGINYKLNFGVELPRLNDIAREFEPSHELAQALWKENIRECKILAGLLQPVETFYPEIAEIWIESMPTAEIAQLTVMNLIQKMPYASEKAFQWVAREEEMFQLCGYLLFARLFMKGCILNQRAEEEFLDQAASTLNCQNPSLRRAVISALQKFGEQNEASEVKAENVLKTLKSEL